MAAIPKYIALDFIHVVAISIWSGGVVAFATVATPAVRDPKALGALTWRFSLTALVCVAVLITTGTLQALDRLVLLEDLYETPYGLALLVKILLLVALVALGALNLLVWGPRLRRGAILLRPRAHSDLERCHRDIRRRRGVALQQPDDPAAAARDRVALRAQMAAGTG